MFVATLTFGEETLDDRGLTGIVIGHKSDENVRVQRPHSPIAPRAIASSISWSVIGRPRGDLMIPLSDRKSVLMAFSENRPVLSFTKSTRSPGFRPIWSRTSLGIVIWPFDVTVLLGMMI